MKEIELLKIIFKDSPDILEPLNEIDKEIESLKLIIATAIRIYEKCEETQDYSTCDLDMYEVLKGVHNG